MQGVCHRDLKLENSLLDKPIPETAAFNLATLMSSRPRLKICDFGYSKARGCRWLRSAAHEGLHAVGREGGALLGASSKRTPVCDTS